MSIPPNNPPPGNFYTAPPSPPRSSSGGCWKAAGITCGLLLLLGIVGVFFIAQTVKREIAHPSKGSPIAFGINLGKASANGVKIQKAIVQYHTHHGKYPNRLTDLVADGLIDGKILHNDLDASSSDPGHISYKYMKPDQGAAGDTPLLDFHYRTNISFGGQTQSQEGHVIINLNGTTTTSQSYSQQRQFQIRSRSSD